MELKNSGSNQRFRINDDDWKKFKASYKVGDVLINHLVQVVKDHLFFVKITGRINALIRSSIVFDRKNIDYDPQHPNKTFFWFEITVINDEDRTVSAKCLHNIYPDPYLIYQFNLKHQIGDVFYNVPLIYCGVGDKKYAYLEVAPGVCEKICIEDDFYNYVSYNHKVNVKIKTMDNLHKTISFELINPYQNDGQSVVRIIKEKQYPLVLTKKFNDLLHDKLDFSELNIEDSKTEIQKYIQMLLFEDIKTKELFISTGVTTNITLVIHPVNNNNIDSKKFIYDEKGAVLCMGATIRHSEKIILFHFVGSSSLFFQNAITTYTNINVKSAAENLLDIIIPGETWSYSGREENHILTQYLRFTYSKALIDKNIQVSKDNLLSIFNTGLVNEFYDDIYCVFTRPDTTQKWDFDCFCTQNDSNGINIIDKFDFLPPKNKYIKSLDDVLFDSSIEITVNIEHILEQNLKRFDLSYLKFLFYGRHEKLTKLFDKYDNNNNISNKKKIHHQIIDEILGSNTYLKAQIIADLNTAVQLVKKRCDWAYNTAIPIFYALDNKLSLVLPLSFSVDFNKKKQDMLALVVTKEINSAGKPIYKGKTVLTLEQAYLDARLICKPNSDWLIIDSSPDEFDNDEDEF